MFHPFLFCHLDPSLQGCFLKDVEGLDLAWQSSAVPVEKISQLTILKNLIWTYLNLVE